MTDIQEAIGVFKKYIDNPIYVSKENLEAMKVLLDTAQAHIELLEKIEVFKGMMPKKKEIIDIKKKMCHNLEYPSPCIYDDPTGGTCMEKTKETCKDYRDMQVEYEDFAEYNLAIDDCTLALTSKISKERIIKALYKWDDRWLLCWDGEGEGEAFDCGCCLDNGQHSEKCRCHCHPRERKLSEAIYNDLIGGIIA
jgi:hypothetical protein